jgi:hypothetical protein
MPKNPHYDVMNPALCVCGHRVHANIGGCGACRSAGCPCKKFHSEPMPSECECAGCWRESNMPPVTGPGYDPA